MNSRLIALSAVSAGLSAVFLTLGAYFQVVDIFCIVLAAIPVTLPLYRESPLAAVLSFLAGGLLAFIFAGMNIMSLVFPAYFAFFGWHPIVNYLFRKKNVPGGSPYPSSSCGLWRCFSGCTFTIRSS